MSKAIGVPTMRIAKGTAATTSRRRTGMRRVLFSTAPRHQGPLRCYRLVRSPGDFASRGEHAHSGARPATPACLAVAHRRWAGRVVGVRDGLERGGPAAGARRDRGADVRDHHLRRPAKHGRSDEVTRPRASGPDSAGPTVAREQQPRGIAGRTRTAAVVK
jgi:hypothetical protein